MTNSAPASLHAVVSDSENQIPGLPATLAVPLYQTHRDRARYLVEEAALPEGDDIYQWSADQVIETYVEERAKEYAISSIEGVKDVDPKRLRIELGTKPE
jgi:hypothetical protein